MNEWIAIIKRDKETEVIAPTKWEYEPWKDSHFPTFDIYYQIRDALEFDQLFSISQDRVHIQDGIILNLKELKEEIGKDNLEDIFSSDNYLTVVRKLIGPNCGLYYYEGQWMAYTNKTGDAPVFYYEGPSFILVSNDFNLIPEYLLANHIQYHFDELAAKALMTYGYMIDNRTMISEAKRVSPGCFISLKDNVFFEKPYHHFCFKDEEMSEEYAIEVLDELFCKAVERCFSKDIEYSFDHHLADMSGGMDSRMTNCVAKELGFENVVNINYCQSKSKEFDCASKAASLFNNQFIYKQLDDHSFLYEIDEMIDQNYGLSIFCGITGGRQLLKSLSSTSFLLEHTGQLGDVIVGTYGNSNCHIPIQQKSFRYSNTLDFSIPEEVHSSYANNEDFGFYCRGFRGILSSHLIRRNYFYPVSPFLDPDFMEFCFSVPMNLRNGQKLYWKWVDTKHATAGLVESTRKRPVNSLEGFFRKVIRRVRAFYIKVGIRFQMPYFIKMANSMNPFNYWWATDEYLRWFVKDYFEKNISKTDCYPTIKNDVIKLYDSEKVIDKLLAINVLGILKRYFVI